MEKRHVRVVLQLGRSFSDAKARKNRPPAEKFAILRRHVLDGVPVSYFREQYELQPTMFYLWQKQLSESGSAALERKHAAPQSHHLRPIAALRQKLQRKDEVVAELMEEHLQIKKGAWGTLTKAWVPHNVRDDVVGRVAPWSTRT